MNWTTVYEISVIGVGHFVLIFLTLLLIFFAVYFYLSKARKMAIVPAGLAAVLIAVFCYSYESRAVYREALNAENGFSIIEGRFQLLDTKKCIYPEKIHRCGAWYRTYEVGNKQVFIHSNPHILNDKAEYCMEQFDQLEGKVVKFYYKSFQTDFTKYRESATNKHGEVVCIYKAQIEYGAS